VCTSRFRPTRIHQAQEQLRYVSPSETGFQLTRYGAARAREFLLAFARANRAFNVAAIGFRLAFDKRAQFFENVFEYFRVAVVIFDDTFQQLVYAVPDFAINADPDVLSVPQLRQLVQHFNGRVRTLRVVSQELRVFRGELVERDLQPLHPAANTFRE
jgi:hypothetical protein